MQWKGIHGLAWASAWPPGGGLCWVRGQEAMRPGWGSRRPERRASGLLVGGLGGPGKASGLEGTDHCLKGPRQAVRGSV